MPHKDKEIANAYFREYGKKQRASGKVPLSKVLSNLANQARKRNIQKYGIENGPSSSTICGWLKKKWEEQNGICALSGTKMTFISGQGLVDTNVSIDRIDSSKHYTEDNIQLICHKLNSMKSNLPDPTFIDWCKKVAEYNV